MSTLAFGTSVSLRTGLNPAGVKMVLPQDGRVHVMLDGRWKMLHMGAVPGAPSSYVVGLPVTSNHSGETVRYYFTTDDAAGQTCFTSIFSVPMK